MALVALLPNWVLPVGVSLSSGASSANLGIFDMCSFNILFTCHLKKFLTDQFSHRIPKNLQLYYIKEVLPKSVIL